MKPSKIITVIQDHTLALPFDLVCVFYHLDNSPFIIYLCSVDFCQCSVLAPLQYDTYFSVLESNYECF